jgi:Chaperone of endosialidase
LEKVQGLRGVSYDWKADGKHDIGLIAEEVGKVIPEVVVYEENGEEATAVDYAGLVPVLIEAVKEQQQLLEEKDAQIAALQKGNHELEARITALEVSAGTEGKGVQAGLLPFSASVMWTLAGGLGLLLVTPELALGYRRIKRYE